MSASRPSYQSNSSFQTNPADRTSIGSGGRTSFNEKQKNAGSMAPAASTIKIEVDLEEVADVAGLVNKFLYKDLPNTVIGTYKDVKYSLTPSFIHRMNNKKIHAMIVESKEHLLEDINEDVNDTIVRELENKRLERKRLKFLKEIIESNKHIRDEVKKAVTVAEEVKKDGEFQAYAQRRDDQLAELKVYNP